MSSLLTESVALGIFGVYHSVAWSSTYSWCCHVRCLKRLCCTLQHQFL